MTRNEWDASLPGKELEPFALVVDTDGRAVGSVPACNDPIGTALRWDSQPDLLQATKGFLCRLDNIIRRDEDGEIEPETWQFIGPLLLRSLEVVGAAEGWDFLVGPDALPGAKGFLCRVRNIVRGDGEDLVADDVWQVMGPTLLRMVEEVATADGWEAETEAWAVDWPEAPARRRRPVEEGQRMLEAFQPRVPAMC